MVNKQHSLFIFFTYIITYNEEIFQNSGCLSNATKFETFIGKKKQKKSFCRQHEINEFIINNLERSKMKANLWSHT